MSRGRGRGGAALTFNAELLGFGRGGDAAPTSAIAPPPKYPPRTGRPCPLDEGPHQDYLLNVQKELMARIRSSGFYVREAAEAAPLHVDWSRFPEELRPDARKKPSKKRRRTAVDAKPKKVPRRTKSPEEEAKRLEELEKKEKEAPGEEEGEEKKGDDSDEDEEKEEQADDSDAADEDEELDDGTDYANNYFDNGEGYDDEDDNLDEGGIY
jgi:DNA-directed RNA polymerase III subunit RPC7